MGELVSTSSVVAFCIALMAIIPIALRVFAGRQATREIERRLGGRERLGDTQLLRLFNPKAQLDDATVMNLLFRIGDQLGIDESQLRPTDRFDTELAAADKEPPCTGTRQLMADLDRELSRRGDAHKLAAVQTVGDYVAAMAGKS
jgi:hypothetical protein